MARVTHVKKAEQRYRTVPVIDPATGEQKVVPVMRKDGVTPKTTKKGREIVRRLTQADKTQPLPNRKCGKCGVEIEVGQPYKWIAPKSGPYGGRKLFRCGPCPVWHRWEYSSSLSARCEQIAHEAHEAFDVAQDEDDVQSVFNDAAEQIRELASEKNESAESIEEGFGHETYQSAELKEQAEALESWADEVEQVDLGVFPDPEEEECSECVDGKIEEEGKPEDEWEDCEECSGSGQITPEDPTDEQLEEWKADINIDIVDESPV